VSFRVEIQFSEGIDEAFGIRVRTWVNEVLERKGAIAAPPFMSVMIWKKTEDLNAFYLREKKELGFVSGEDAEFLATHEAWRGYPRIHICQERVKHVPDAVLQGVLHHEISHAVLHGTPEFYTFRYSNRLQTAGRILGLDLAFLQECVYLLSIAVKDCDVVTYLAGIGLGQGQLALIDHMICDTDPEYRLWSMVCDQPGKRKLVLAVIVKTLLPIQVLISKGVKEAEIAGNQWKNAYHWLPESVQARLVRFSRNIMMDNKMPFQGRLEEATLRLITDSFL
jgi:hypothetical protein